MKKIVAALGTLLFVAGVKAQTTPVNKPTTPQVKNNTAATSVNGSSLKITQKAGTTVKTSQKIAQNSPLKVTQKVALKVAPTIKKTGR